MWIYDGLNMPCPPRGQRALRNIPEWENEEEFQDTYFRFVNQELMRYDWDGLPETCDARFLELSFIHYGKAMIARDGEKVVTLHTNPYDQMNMYGYFRRATGWAWNGYTNEFEVYVPGTDPKLFKGDAVIGYDNPTHYPYHFYLTHLTERYMRAIRAIDTTIENLKTPYIITCPEDRVETVKAAIKKKKSNHEVIILSEGLNSLGQDIQVFPQGTTPAIASEMWKHFYNIDNLGKENRGINSNPAPQKMERELTSEVNANNMITSINAEYRLLEREKFALLVNECLGLSITVSDRFAEYQENELQGRLYDPNAPQDKVKGDDQIE